MKLEVNIEKKHLIIFSCLIAMFGIVLVTNAYSLSGTGGTPEVMGHSADELDIEFEGSMQSIQNVFNSLDSNGDGIIDDAEYANTAGSADNVQWDNVNNKPSVIENSDEIATKDYVDANAGIPDRSWHNVKGSRNKDQTYTNSRSYPIELAVTSSYGGSAYTNYCRLKIVIDGTTIIDQQNNNPSYSKKCSTSVTVPAGSTYRVVVDGYKTGEVNTWNELY